MTVAVQECHRNWEYLAVPADGCLLPTELNRKLLISGSQVRVLLRPPNKHEISAVYVVTHERQAERASNWKHSVSARTLCPAAWCPD
jgi:hypothetical protein